MFEKLKKRMTTAPVLAVPDNKYKFQMRLIPQNMPLVKYYLNNKPITPCG